MPATVWTRATLESFIQADAVLCAVNEHVRAALDSDPAHDVEHVRRVALSTLRLGPLLDLREAICSALLHDVVNLPKNHPERASASRRSAEVSRELLAALPEASRERIAQAIEDHSFSAGRTPRSDLGEALQDADRLEALGALGLARTFSTGERLGARYFDAADPWALERPLDDRRFSVDHFFTKLLGLPATFRTVAGRQEAERRVRLLETFLDALADEIGVARPARAAGAGQGPSNG